MSNKLIVLTLIIFLSACGAQSVENIDLIQKEINRQIETSSNVDIIYNDDKSTPLKRVIDKELNIVCYFQNTTNLFCLKMDNSNVR